MMQQTSSFSHPGGTLFGWAKLHQDTQRGRWIGPSTFGKETSQAWDTALGKVAKCGAWDPWLRYLKECLIDFVLIEYSYINTIKYIYIYIINHYTSELYIIYIMYIHPSTPKRMCEECESPTPGDRWSTGPAARLCDPKGRAVPERYRWMTKEILQVVSMYTICIYMTLVYICNITHMYIYI